ncbi:hypothetical protein [Sandaracinus amylolyticus]|uniref:Glycosyltransferase RgtA/B/C/D-like domain-containing protein n=1 Tax=Sandaracinus amylolyticus TaxID=927083 RepID=A0A0F6W3P5_9BACT|nr:hypothetical protein [Sandaracinus amylolyticus]AKF06508.1 hypothetical protein DB32_003657 [Sandaracinus amylolyticus]
MRVLVPLAGVVLIALHASLYAGYVIDDAWISFRYARHLAHGLGLVFNEGERVEGYTNFLWVVLAAPFTSMRVERVMAGIGLACACATLVIAVLRARRDDPSARFAGVPTALGLACMHGLAFHAVGGLETPLYALLVLVASLMLADGRALPFAIATTLAFLTRPEAALLGLGGTLFLAHRSKRDGALALGAFVLLVTPYLVFKLAYFGALLPNTLHAKPPGLVSGARYLARELLPAIALVVAAIVGARTNERHRVLVVIALAFLAAVLLEGGDWMPGGRMIVPWLAPLFVAADRPIRALFTSTHRARVIAIVAVLAIVPWQIARSAELVMGTRARVPIDAARIELADRLAHEDVRSIALLDIGLVGWRAEHARIVDLGGLVDRTIAASPGPHGAKRADLDYLESLAPEVVILTSARDATRDAEGRVHVGARFVAEQHLEESAWLREHYEHVETRTPARVYRMHVFRRRLD